MIDEDEQKVDDAIEERKGFGEPDKKEDAAKDEKKSESEEAEEESSDSKKESAEEEESKEKKEDSEEEEKKDEEEELEPEEKEEEEPKKTGAQRRIDGLIAEKARLEERLSALEGKVSKADEDKKDKGFTDAELDRAEKKAITEQDMSLLAEVYKERNKNLEKKLVKMYTDEQTSKSQKSEAKTKQWQAVEDRYKSDDPKMDIRSKNSDLYKTAKAFFEDPELKEDYSGSDGMSKAVADAFLELSRIKGKKKTSDKDKPSRKEGKDKIKKSLAASSEDKSKEKKDKKDEDKETGDPVKDFIAERKADKNKRLGTE